MPREPGPRLSQGTGPQFQRMCEECSEQGSDGVPIIASHSLIIRIWETSTCHTSASSHCERHETRHTLRTSGKGWTETAGQSASESVRTWDDLGSYRLAGALASRAYHALILKQHCCLEIARCGSRSLGIEQDLDQSLGPCLGVSRG